MIKTIGKVGSALLLAFLLGAGPATNPATQPGPGGYAQDAFDLGSADFAVRQLATQRLWWAAEPAEPALKQAAGGGNPEAAERARALLRDIDDGIAPSTSPAVIQFVRQYRAAGEGQMPVMIAGLRGQGIDGVRVLLQLAEHEKDAKERGRIERALSAAPRLPVALLLSEGRRAEAEAMLADGASLNVSPAHDFVAYWHVRPASVAKTAALRQVSINQTWWAQALIEEADGDRDDALRDAATTGYREPGNWLAAQSGDWSTLQRQLAPRRPRGQLRDFELRALAARLAGDSAAEQTSQNQILALPPVPAPPADSWQRPAALCVIGDPDDAVKLMLAAGDFLDAGDVYETRLQYAQELALLDRVKGNALHTAMMQSRAAVLLNFLGRKSAADEMLKHAIEAYRLRLAQPPTNDPSLAGQLAIAAWRMGRIDDADALLAEILASGQPLLPNFFERIGLPAPADADQCWLQFLSQRQSKAPPATKAIQTLRALAGGHVPMNELSALIDEMEKWSASQPSAVQQAVLRAEAAAWMWARRPEKAMPVLARQAEEFPGVPAFMALGDCAEQQQDWSAAADAYGRAAQYDPAFASATFLHGWALTKLGQETQGRELMDLAHELPCGDENVRTDLFLTAQKRGLTADAERERDALLTTGNFDSPGIVPILELSAEDAEGRRDYATAARYREQALWAVAYSRTQLRNPGSFLHLSAEVYRLRAMALFAANQPDRAMIDAKMWYAMDPNFGTGLIALVRAADAAGAIKEADELFDTSIAQFAALLKEYPDAPDLHNQIAWEESRCRRKLDDALTHAQRAATLEPRDAAILDTLAETHYQRKEFQSAIDTMNRCIALEPSDARFGKQLARFQLALKTGVADDE